MNRLVEYLSIEMDKAIVVLHSLLKSTGTWSLGDHNSEDYSKVIQETILNNYGGLNAARLEEIRMLTVGTTTISTLVTPRVKGSNKCKDKQVLKTKIMPIIDTGSMMVYHQRKDGLWENAAERDVCHFSLNGFFSGFTRLDGREARMVVRS